MQFDGLGEVLGIYRTEVTPPLGARRALWLLAPPAGYVAVVVVLVAAASDAALPLLRVSPCLGGLYAGACFLFMHRRRFTRYLYGCTGGMAEVDPGGVVREVRWDEVVDVVDAWSSAGPESSGWSYDGFLLTTADGRTVLVTGRYGNADDPSVPVAGLSPGEAGAIIRRRVTIADLIQDRAVSPVVARQVRAVNGGAALVRGGVRVTRDGIAGTAKSRDATVTPWAAIARIELRPGRVRVHPAGRGRARTYNDYRDGSGYAVLCRLLVALGVAASFEAVG